MNDSGAVVRMHEKTKILLGIRLMQLCTSPIPVYYDGDFLCKPPSDFSVEVIPKLLGRIVAWANQGYHEDIGTPETYQKVNSAEVTISQYRGSWEVSSLQ